MAGLAGVTRAQERDLRLAVAEALDAAARDEGQRLQRLERAAGRREVTRIARRKQQPAGCVHDCDGAIMDAVGGVTSGNERERYVRRGRGSDGGWQRRGESAGNAYFSANRFRGTSEPVPRGPDGGFPG